MAEEEALEADVIEEVDEAVVEEEAEVVAVCALLQYLPGLKEETKGELMTHGINLQHLHMQCPG